MQFDDRLWLLAEAQDNIWLARLNELHKDRRLHEWISSFHPERRPCYHAAQHLNCGSYNLGTKYIFDDGTLWWVRFPNAGHVHTDLIDEKTAMEVATMKRIRRETTIPVPEIKAWGLAAENTTGLGPFIIMECIETEIETLDSIRDEESCSRLIRQDISATDLEVIYRQLANFQIQLWQLDFSKIGNVVSESHGMHFPARPLTMKHHDILKCGGVDVSDTGDAAFSCATNYFQTVIEQDWRQLLAQPNSTITESIARSRYRALKVLKGFLPRFVHPDYDRKAAKFFCDDLGLANLIFDSRETLKIEGVIDLEWSYAAPAQMAITAPWWLLMDRPTNQSWDCCNGVEPAALVARYFDALEIYKRVLREEEAKMMGPEFHEYTDLVQWSQDSGAMWLHMLLVSAFNSYDSFPFHRLIEHVGREAWMKLEDEIDENEVEEFVKAKMLQLAQYNLELAKIEADKQLVSQGELKKEDFVIKYEQSLVAAGPVSKRLTEP